MMPEQKSMEFTSAWERLPKADQEKIKRQLKSIPEKDNNSAKPKPKNGFQLKGYVRCELSSADKDTFREWESGEDIINVNGRMIDLVEDGYLLKVGDTGNGYQASLCASATGKAWEGYVLTAHASYAKRAVHLLWYKHAMMMEGDWSAWMSDEGEDFIR
jgi:hypothetical protein